MTTATQTAPDTTEKRGRHTISDIFHERTHFDIVGRSWRWALLSGTIILIGLISLGVRGLNLGIDFKGGTQWEFQAKSAHVSSGSVRSSVQSIVPDATILIVNNNKVRVQSKNVDATTENKVTDALAKYAHIAPSAVTINSVGPTWGHEVSSKALRALIVFFVLIALYLSFRFEFKMAVAAILAVLHDIVVTVGVYALTQFEVTPATVVAFLTILGFSLYDTVVVFDKIKENVPTLGTIKGDTYSAMANRSMNQVLMRSLNTSFVALLPVFSLLVVGSYILGAIALEDFALALFVGLLTGAYSSIFVATPILAWWKEREPRYRTMRERAETLRARSAAVETPAPAAPAVRDVEPDVEPDGEAALEPPGEPVAEPARAAAAARPAPAPRQPGGVTPRPRQQRRRKRR
ncbi:MAG TPA: protein translocase subunit SecF [Acidimicrobiia bacterium]|nr:protein translocase subunit SecF [Acidimicrobiia bacterium]